MSTKQSPDDFLGPKSAFMFTVFALKIKSFNNFENDTMKESVKKQIKLTGSWARNRATIQQVLISKFVFGHEKLLGLSRNGPLVQ